MKGDQAKLNSKGYLYAMIIHIVSPSAKRSFKTEDKIKKTPQHRKLR
jgi:uncharacterized membrane protein YiaA